MSKWEVNLHSDVSQWFLGLGSDEAEAVAGAIDLLEDMGPTLGRPTVDLIKGSKHHLMKELRPAGTSIRILFAFDPAREAILLVAGDKAGEWKSWYKNNIPVADERFDDWKAQREAGE